MCFAVALTRNGDQVREFKRLPVAPEVINESTYAPKPKPAADVYGLGTHPLPCLALLVLTPRRHHPFRHADAAGEPIRRRGCAGQAARGAASCCPRAGQGLAQLCLRRKTDGCDWAWWN